MPLHWHVNLPGPVGYSRPLRKKRKGSGPLTTLLVWFTVMPMKLMLKGLAKTPKLAAGLARPHNLAPQLPAYMPVGWYQTQYGPLWFNGRVWVRPDGRPF